MTEPTAASAAPRTPGAGWVVGVDTGGTFTDAVAISDDGRVVVDKAFSTPDDPSVGALDAVANVAARLGLTRDALLPDCSRFAHGTTVGTNALIQRSGARVALVTTRGFEDTVVISRGPLGKNTGIPLEQALDFIHNEKPDPYVERRRTFGVSERVDLDGDVIAPLSHGDVLAAAEAIGTSGADSVAVCLLWSFRNPDHERAVRDLLADRLPGIDVSLSSEVSPVSGEYERTMTTVVNAYVAPVLSRYLARLADALAVDGLRFPLQIMTAAGGTVFPRDVGRRAVSLINGGPVGGLVAARELGRTLGIENVITTDMGGTSFDVGIIHRGRIRTEASTFVSQGVPVQLEAAKVVAIGAGGGSIAWTDGERLLVGPGSAGSRPGPACYDAGGTQPTVTDALVVLGFIDPRTFFGGRKRLRRDLAETAIAEHVARPLGMSMIDAAAGIYEIVTARMGDLVRQVTVQEGLDPRDFTVVAYGGASPLHAAVYAEPLGVREVIVPPTSSVFSALGCALSDTRYVYARSSPVRLDAPDAQATADAIYAELGAEARSDVSSSGADAASAVLQRRADVRYAGQMNELTVAVPAGSAFGVEARRAFESEYALRYGAATTRASSPVEVITFRLEALVPTSRPPFARPPARDGGTLTPIGTRDIVTRRYGSMAAAVFAGADLRPGDRIEGPAMVDRPDTTIFVPPGHLASVDELGNVRIAVGR